MPEWFLKLSIQDISAVSQVVQNFLVIRSAGPTWIMILLGNDVYMFEAGRNQDLEKPNHTESRMTIPITSG